MGKSLVYESKSLEPRVTNNRIMHITTVLSLLRCLQKEKVADKKGMLLERSRNGSPEHTHLDDGMRVLPRRN